MNGGGGGVPPCNRPNTSGGGGGGEEVPLAIAQIRGGGGGLLAFGVRDVLMLQFVRTTILCRAVICLTKSIKHEYHYEHGRAPQKAVGPGQPPRLPPPKSGT